MKPYLVDVPVCMLVWTRPELQRMTFEPIRQARPSALFLASDGGRNEAEWKKIFESRKIVENIDWECTVYKIYETENNGMYTMGRKIFEYIFDRVDRVVIFEDDTLANPTYFRFCAELLEKYKDDWRIQWICGKNSAKNGIYELPSSDYFFVHGKGYNSGIALWKRSLQLTPNRFIYNDMEWMNDPYIFDLLKYDAEKIWTPSDKGLGKIVDKIKQNGGRSYDGHLVGPECYGNFMGILCNQLGIVSTKNMVRQMGATDDATHSVALHKLDKFTQQLYTTPIYPVEFPLCHPRYMIRDYRYEEAERADKSSWKMIMRKNITRLKRLYYGDGKMMLRSLWKRFTSDTLEK